MILPTDAELITSLTTHEGYMAKPYKDTKGKITIGVGRNLTDKGISDSEISMLLQNDIKQSIHEVEFYFPWAGKMTPARQRVLVEMCFNMGIAVLRTFHKTLLSMAQGFYDEAAHEMLQSEWAKEVGHRAVELSNKMRVG
jgi:lysozyme